MSKLIKITSISIIIIVFLVSISWNLVNLWRKQQAKFFNAGVNQAVLSIYQQVKNVGEIQISDGKNPIILIPKQNEE